MGLDLDLNLSNRVRVINHNTEYPSEMLVKLLDCPPYSNCPIFIAVDNRDLGVVVGYDPNNHNLLTVRTASGNRRYDQSIGIFLSDDLITSALSVQLNADNLPEIDSLIPMLLTQHAHGSVFYSPVWEILSWNHLSVVVPLHRLTGSFLDALGDWLLWHNLQISDNFLIEAANRKMGPVYNYAQISGKKENNPNLHIFQDGASFVTFKGDKRMGAENVMVDFFNINQLSHCPFNHLGTGVSKLLSHGFIPYHISNAVAAERIPELITALVGCEKMNACANLRDSYR